MDLRLIPLSDGWAIVMGIVVWAVAGTAIGYAFHRLPVGRFTHDGPFTRLRAFERDGRVYERRLRIRAWKDRLPEGGALFEGGFSKRHVGGRSPAQLERFVAETRRAERTHWVVLGLAPLFVLWSPPVLAVAMIVYGLLANLPCLLIQRYNRARLVRTVALMRRNEARRAARAPTGVVPSGAAPPRSA
jgi:glycosyl-4,4'-diaponeurosporenoate acyltransferase